MKQELDLLRVKYSANVNANTYDVLELILSQDKYLRLAHAMKETRNDWSNGFYRVLYALLCFKVENEFDNDVIDLIQAILDDEEDDGDGRIFRDCEINYNDLYEKVNSELFQDYERLLELVNQ